MKLTFRQLACAALILGALLLMMDGRPNDARATHDLPCPDVTGNGEVEFNDIDVVASWLFYPPPWPPAVDVDGDGILTFPGDLLLVAQALGTTTSCQDTPAHGRPPFPGLGDDVMPSLGTFRVVVVPGFRALMAGYPGYDGVSRLDSPTMSDGATRVGRSAVHTDGDGADAGGTPVGLAGTLIADSAFSLIPPGFQGPVGTREVHTELRTMNLTGGGAAVRAGTMAPARPMSPGEVEAISGSGNPDDDWPAQSFFDVFVEVDLPAFAGFPGSTLYNSAPLLVESISLERFPPRIVYYHGNTSAVPVYFKTTNPGFWQAGDLFGHLVLAGHGANFSPDSGSVQQFEVAVDEIEEEQGELPPPFADVDADWVFDNDDNCPLDSNPAQDNFDNAIIGNGPPIAPDDDTIPNGDADGDACDADDDNDGLPDTEDLNPLLFFGVCGMFAGATDGHPNPARGDITQDDNLNSIAAPTLGFDAADNGPSWDTDGDGVRDGVECMLGTNPRSRLSRPTMPACGGTGDADGDGLFDGAELCKWGTGPGVINSDGDALGDCAEAADIDGDGFVTFPGDVLGTSNAYFAGGADVALDIDGDGLITFPGDVLRHAGYFFANTPCL